MPVKSIELFSWKVVFLISFITFSLALSTHAPAMVKPPVHVNFITGWKAAKGGPFVHVAQKGQELPFRIAISSDIDIEAADFELIVPPSMEIVSGPKNWSGGISKGKMQILKVSVRIISDTVGVLRGELFLPAFGISVRGMLDLRDPATTDRIPEFGENTTVLPNAKAITPEDPGEGNYPNNLPPEPYIEQLDFESEIKRLGGSDGGVEGSCNVVATGRLVYTDDNGNTIGIHGARVILWDQDDDLDDECGRGVTDWNGYFSISGSCGDVWNPFGDTENPDIYIQIYAENTNYAKVGAPYTSVNPTINEHCGTYNYGTRVVPSSHAGAYQLFNQAVEANKYIDLYDTMPPMVQINWPASGSGAWYNGQIYITDTTPWSEPTLYHEYGHFVMDKYADLPTFNYCNGICDASATDCGHCIWRPETGYIHYMEGWPNFFADVQSDYWSRDDSYGFEVHSATADTYPVSQRDEIEGITASILWDLYDPVSDNQHNDNPRDNLSLGFNEIWNITTNYDPGGTYDYPMTIHEFWTGFYNTYSGYRQGLWSIYAEHHINKDIIPPLNPTSVTSSSHSTFVWSNDRTINLSWSGATDNLSGVDGYGLYVNTSSTSSPSNIIDTTGTAYTTTSLSDGSSWYFHLKTADRAGNWTSAVVHRGPYRIDGTAPTGLISINSGAVYTNSRTVTLNLSASDATSGVSQMRFANYFGIYSSWESYQTSKQWTLKDIDGTRRVYVQYRDNAGNISVEKYDEIRLDRVAPTGSIVINGGDPETNSLGVILYLSATDLNGVDSMRFSNDNITWSLWEAYGSTKTGWDLSTYGGGASLGIKTVFVQFMDYSENASVSYSDNIEYIDNNPLPGIYILLLNEE